MAESKGWRAKRKSDSEEMSRKQQMNGGKRTGTVAGDVRRGNEKNKQEERRCGKYKVDGQAVNQQHLF